MASGACTKPKALLGTTLYMLTPEIPKFGTECSALANVLIIS